MRFFSVNEYAMPAAPMCLETLGLANQNETTLAPRGGGVGFRSQ
jgi:hypothetical protein